LTRPLSLVKTLRVQNYNKFLEYANNQVKKFGMTTRN